MESSSESNVCLFDCTSLYTVYLLGELAKTTARNIGRVATEAHFLSAAVSRNKRKTKHASTILKKHKKRNTGRSKYRQAVYTIQVYTACPYLYLSVHGPRDGGSDMKGASARLDSG